MLQNPKNTPVTLKMKDAELTHVHVSQNVPQRSPMEVVIDMGKRQIQIHIIVQIQVRTQTKKFRWRLTGQRLARSRSPNPSQLLHLLPGTSWGIQVRITIRW